MSGSERQKSKKGGRFQRTRQRGKGISLPAAGTTKQLSDGHQAKKPALNRNGWRIKAYRKSAVFSAALLSAFIVTFSFAIHYLRMKAYSVAIRWAFGTYFLFGLGIAFVVDRYIISAKYGKRRRASKPGRSSHRNATRGRPAV